ncbi:MAG: hypothetical protein Q7R52_03955 [archaeon]|nr:hypothetical protein [archaeon]
MTEQKQSHDFYTQYLEEHTFADILAEGKEKKKVSNLIINPKIQSLDGFIYVPSINLYVAEEKTCLGKNWFECHEKLQKEKMRMLTISEFLEFLKYTEKNHSEIYNKITKIVEPSRTEWLDAFLKKEGEYLRICSKPIFDSLGGILRHLEIRTLNKDTLMENRLSGISLDDWIKNPTSLGFPRENVKPGNLYYWPPEAENNGDFVAHFNTDFSRNSFYFKTPHSSYTCDGVHAVLPIIN